MDAKNTDKQEKKKEKKLKKKKEIGKGEYFLCSDFLLSTTLSPHVVCLLFYTPSCFIV